MDVWEASHVKADDEDAAMDFSTMDRCDFERFLAVDVDFICAGPRENMVEAFFTPSSGYFAFGNFQGG